jgi:hypothetical protein
MELDGKRKQRNKANEIMKQEMQRMINDNFGCERVKHTILNTTNLNKVTFFFKGTNIYREIQTAHAYTPLVFVWED